MNLSRQKFKTSAEYAYQVICQQILSGELPPGQHLTRKGMAELTGVSIIPVIEALHRLESEGLVISEPHFGAKVIDIDDNIIRDRFALRMAIECQVVRILALNKEQEQIRRLSFLARELDETDRQDTNLDIFWTRHYEFHLQLAQLTGYQSFYQQLARLNLFDILRRCIHTYSQAMGTQTPYQHHEKIILAISSGDPEKAEAAMREHVNFSGLAKENEL